MAIGNFYHANRESPVFNELHQLVLKTVGLVDPLREALTPYRQSIKSAFVYGSIAKGKDTAKSDIDVMIIGEGLAYSEVFSALQQAEKHLARPVNPNLMTTNDWGRKVKAKTAFVTKILISPSCSCLEMKMNSEALNNLVKAKVLKVEPPDQAEFDGLMKLGTNRLKDAHNQDNSPESNSTLPTMPRMLFHSLQCVGAGTVRIVNGSSCFRPCNTH